MIEQEKFAQLVRDAGANLQSAEVALAQAEADEKKQYALLCMEGQANGCKTSASQSTYADADDRMHTARLGKGTAKGLLRAAQSNYLAAEIQFKTWQIQMRSADTEKRVYGS